MNSRVTVDRMLRAGVLNRGTLALLRGPQAQDLLMVVKHLRPAERLSVFRLLQKNWLPISSACSNGVCFVCDVTKRTEDLLHTCSH